jgi:7-cyano-7-deazaguanine synthase
MGNRVVLLSGGIDSLVCASLYRGRDQLAGCVFVDYGQPAAQWEEFKSGAYCGRYGVPLRVVKVRGANLGGLETEVGARVMPGRNLMLLSIGANLLDYFGADTIAIGCNHADQRDYPDCRRDWLRSVEPVLGCAVDAPLVHMGKRQIVALARSQRLDQSDAWSCYLGGDGPCGECPSCVEATHGWGA